MLVMVTGDGMGYNGCVLKLAYEQQARVVCGRALVRKGRAVRGQRRRATRGKLHLERRLRSSCEACSTLHDELSKGQAVARAGVTHVWALC